MSCSSEQRGMRLFKNASGEACFLPSWSCTRTEVVLALKRHIQAERNVRGGELHCFLPRFEKIDHHTQVMLEGLGLTLLTMFNCESTVGKVSVLLLFLKSHCSNFCGQVVDLVKSMGDALPAFTLQANVEDKWQEFAQSEFFKKVNVLWTCVTTCSLLGYSTKVRDIEKEAKNSSFMQFLDCTSVVSYIISCIRLVITNIQQFLTTGNFSDLFHSSDTYGEWARKVQECERDYAELQNKNEKVDRHKLISDLRMSVKVGKEILATLNKQRKDMTAAHRVYLRALELDTMLSCKAAAQQTRKAPYALLLSGPSSVGKTTLQNLLFMEYGKTHNKPITEEYKYSMNCDDDFDQDFETSQWCIELDDAAPKNPTYCPTGDRTTECIMRIVNNVARTAIQADLADKGKNVFLPELVLISTNVSHLSLNDYYKCPYAFARRIPARVDMVPKDEFRASNGSLCVPQGYTGPSDFWTFKVYQVVPTQKYAGDPPVGEEHCQGFRHELLHDFDTIGHLLNWFNNSTTAHNNNQVAMLDSLQSARDSPLCDGCRVSQCYCICDQHMCPECHDLFDNCVCADQKELNEMAHDAEFSLQSKDKLSIIEPWSLSQVITQCMFYVLFIVFFQWLIFHFLPNAAHEVQHCVSILSRAIVVTQEVVNAIRSLGKQVYLFLGGTIILAVLLGVLASMATIYKTLFSASLQGKSEVVGSPIKLDAPEKENVWKKKDYVLSTYDVPRASSSYKGMSDQVIVDILNKSNCLEVEIVSRISDVLKKTTTVQLLRVGNLCYTTTHSLGKGRMDINVKHAHAGKGISCVTNSALSSTIRGELSFFELVNVPFGKSIVELVPSVVLTELACDGFVCVFRNGQLKPLPIKKIKLSSQKLGDMSEPEKLWQYQYVDEQTIEGDCGGVIVAKAECGPMIIGLHVAMNSTMFSTFGYAVMLLKRDFSMCPHLGTPASVNLTTLQARSEHDWDLTGLHPNSDLRYIDLAHMQVHGSFDRFRVEPRTKFKESRIAPELKRLGYETDFAPPALKGWEVRRNAIDKVVQSNSSADPLIVKACGVALVSRWVTGMPAVNISMLDKASALNGIAGVRFVDRVNLSSSMGFPFCKQKKNFVLCKDELLGMQGPIEFNQEVNQMIDDIFDCYDNDTLYRPVWMTALKDELRKIRKINNKDYRMFFCGPTNFIIFQRMIFLRFIRIVQSNKQLFEQAPGTEAQCIEWEHIRSYILEADPSGERCIFGDFKGFDSSMESSCYTEAYRCIRAFCAVNGATEEHLKYIDMHNLEMQELVVNMFGDLVTLYCKNPSGQALTVIINGIVNSIYNRYVFVRKHPRYRENMRFADLIELAQEFDQMVSLLTYGDDNGSSVSEKCTWFNHTILVKELAKIGVTYTMADKSAESIPFVKFEDGSFLKRTWRYEDDLKHFVCPLELSSIFKSLFYVRCTQFLSENQLIAQQLDTAVRELFWHGRDVFDYHRIRFQNIAEEYDLDVSFLSWEELCLCYEQHSELYLKHMENPLIEELHLQSRSSVICAHCSTKFSTKYYEWHCPSCFLVYKCLQCDTLVKYRSPKRNEIPTSLCPCCAEVYYVGEMDSRRIRLQAHVVYHAVNDDRWEKFFSALIEFTSWVLLVLFGMFFLLMVYVWFVSQPVDIPQESILELLSKSQTIFVNPNQTEEYINLLIHETIWIANMLDRIIYAHLLCASIAGLALGVMGVCGVHRVFLIFCSFVFICAQVMPVELMVICAIYVHRK